MIKPIKKVNISNQVFLQLKEMIIRHEWKPGSKLPSESELCSMFNVSRVTVRNALHKLSALNLIETQLGDGSYVKRLDESLSLTNLIPVAYLDNNIASVLEFRREVESGACAIAAQRATDTDIRDLKQMLEKMAALQNDLNALAAADLEFHYMIARISKNILIIKTYEIMSDIYVVHMKNIVSSMGGETGMYYHEKIVGAIEAHDVGKARTYMFKHIASNEEFLNIGKTEL